MRHTPTSTFLPCTCTYTLSFVCHLKCMTFHLCFEFICRIFECTFRFLFKQDERAGKKLNLLFIPCISNENVPGFFLFRCSEHLKLSIRVSFYWLICSPFVALLHLHCECKRAYWDFKSTLMFYHVWYVCCYSSIQRSFWLHFNGGKNAVNIKNSTSALANVHITSF